MALIALEGIKMFANHGFHPEESIVGNEYCIDVYIEADIEKAVKADDLFSTVNYETVYLICDSEMKKTRKLIETVAAGITSRIVSQFQGIQGTKVRIKKLHPPIDGRIDSAYVEVDTGLFNIRYLIADKLPKIK